jgi:hypothetical protein
VPSPGCAKSPPNKPLKLTVGKRGLPIPSSLRSSAAA